ncbi:MAG TPA: glycosyltransferase 87 family protein, partial [Ktedonobacterales bacterium]|nr:glycosyltransferase 87 family protein [Ktedonobacterales bacterium]
MAVRWKEWAAPALVIAATVATGLLSAGLWDSAGGDIGGYTAYADAFWHGSPPFHALPQEYPALALLPFSLTLSPLPRAPLASFIAGFGLFFFAGYLCCRRFASRAAAARYALYLLLGAQGTLLDRYDLAPALLSVAVLWCAKRKRFGWAYVALAAGAGLKLYPLVLLPVVVIAHYHSLRAAGSKLGLATTRAAVGAAICLISASALVFVPALVTSQQQTWLAYASNRPVQVESVPGTLVWVGTLLGAAAHVDNSFGSQGWVGGLSGAVAGPSLALGLAVFLWLWWRQARGNISLHRAALASLCLLLVSGKVLSAQ